MQGNFLRRVTSFPWPGLGRRESFPCFARDFTAGDGVDMLRGRYANRIHRIALFGSQARGDAREGADVDALVVVDRSERKLTDDITDLAFDIIMKYRVDLEPRIEQEHGFPRSVVSKAYRACDDDRRWQG